MTPRNVAFYDADAVDFPFVVLFYDEATGEELWTRVFPSPGVMRIPGQGQEGRSVGTWICFPHETHVQASDGVTEWQIPEGLAEHPRLHEAGATR